MDSHTATLLGILFSNASISETRDMIAYELGLLYSTHNQSQPSYSHRPYASESESLVNHPIPTSTSISLSHLNHKLESKYKLYRTAFNTLSPILRLPTPLTLKILNTAYDDTYARLEVHIQSFHPVNWVIGWSGVCSAWRRIVLSTPRFWSVVRLDRPRIVPVLLERSGSAPLEIVYLTQSSDSDEGCQWSSMRLQTPRDRVQGRYLERLGEWQVAMDVDPTNKTPTATSFKKHQHRSVLVPSSSPFSLDSSSSELDIWRLLSLHAHRITCLRVHAQDRSEAFEMMNDCKHLWDHLKVLHWHVKQSEARCETG